MSLVPMSLHDYKMGTGGFFDTGGYFPVSGGLLQKKNIHGEWWAASKEEKRNSRKEETGWSLWSSLLGPILLAPLVPSPLTLGQSWGFLRVPGSLSLALASRRRIKVGLTTFGSPRVVRATPLRTFKKKNLWIIRCDSIPKI